MQTSRYQSIKKELKKTQLVDDFLVVEAPLEIQINEKPFAAVMRTPGDDEVLLRGLLYAEDIYKGKAPLRLKNNQTKPNGFAKVQVQISEKELRKGYLNKRTLLSVSSCGICGKQELDSTEIPKKKLSNFRLTDLSANAPKKSEIMIFGVFEHFWLKTTKIEFDLAKNAFKCVFS